MAAVDMDGDMVSCKKQLLYGKVLRFDRRHDRIDKRTKCESLTVVGLPGAPPERPPRWRLCVLVAMLWHDTMVRW